MTLIPDPAGVLPSDAHRRVLAHLSTPDSDYGWTLQALQTSRMAGDYSLVHRGDDGADVLSAIDVLSSILDWALANDYAECNAEGAYRQTPAGHALLEIAPVDPGAPGPAAIDSRTAASGAATAWAPPPPAEQPVAPDPVAAAPETLDPVVP